MRWDWGRVDDCFPHGGGASRKSGGAQGHFLDRYPQVRRLARFSTQGTIALLIKARRLGFGTAESHAEPTRLHPGRRDQPLS